ncbi:putative quinol monooxygenase [Chitinophaga ginsengisoli]|uniref:Quinol monooxygenase YgiN n=1 Tax=Chitinophaga ginsengisoli TaxID=363837 RepID=A0A2P8FNR0_9BACT|nr:antibiotic biosynthesis monooxygenase [Chitinophaga ginsengisoli]PSL23339.1 quinol monooxygenase YgiN [Chitinophaga ginsengisoli]
MENKKIVTLTELLIKPEYIPEVLLSAIKTKDLILLEQGTETFVLSRKRDEPNTLVIFAVYQSQELYQWHLEQPYVIDFFAFLNGKWTAPPKSTALELF